MTTVLPGVYTDDAFARTEASDGPAAISVADGVYRPQEDSALLIDTLLDAGRAEGSRVADLCSGSGVVALAAAAQGAASVAAFERSPRAVMCARANAAAAGANVRVHRGSWTRAAEFAPFDVITCNPPYVPFAEDADDRQIPRAAGPDTAWNAGRDGRQVLDPLCESAPDLLAAGGTMFIVHSEFADADRTVGGLRAGGLHAEVVAEQWIPFGPVLTARAHWLERVGLLEAGRREERLVVVRADRV
ncbi:methylase [Mycolicibacterium madagascariense]|uniref:Methylase n=1 Tax=Mycolicibacterium madagascariense TaxID=212765 RepID=A0A7I7XDA4_9MYCO|nr:methylase [Mycolicibacterium madagascariense]